MERMAKLLLAGATGLVGGEVLKRLLTDERVTHVVAPTRRHLPRHDKLLNPLVDSSNLPADADWWQVDSAICALGTTRAKAGSAAAFRAIDYDYALAVATRAREAGASRFALTSSMGANARSNLLYPRTKGELEEAIDRLSFPALMIVRPGFIGGKRNESRPSEQLMGWILKAASIALPLAARISPASTIAALLVEAALSDDKGKRVINSAAIARAAQQEAR